MTNKSPSHVVMGNDTVRCLNCGHEHGIPYPCSLMVLAAICETYAEEHEGCEPSAAGRARFEYSNAAEWARSWDTGISARTIYEIMGEPDDPQGKHGVPLDPVDFGRCYRLLEVEPSWRAQLWKVSDVHPEWRPLVDNWAKLEALYEEELPTGRAPKLFALLNELNTAGEALQKEKP